MQCPILKDVSVLPTNEKKKGDNPANSINQQSRQPAGVVLGLLRAPNNDQQKPREEEPRCGLAGEDGCAHLAGRRRRREQGCDVGVGA